MISLEVYNVENPRGPGHHSLCPIVAKHAPESPSASKVTGVQAEAIAAAVFEEIMENVYGYGIFRTFFDWAEDTYVTLLQGSAGLPRRA